MAEISDIMAEQQDIMEAAQQIQNSNMSAADKAAAIAQYDVAYKRNQRTLQNAQLDFAKDLESKYAEAAKSVGWDDAKRRKAEEPQVMRYLESLGVSHQEMNNYSPAELKRAVKEFRKNAGPTKDPDLISSYEKISGRKVNMVPKSGQKAAVAPVRRRQTRSERDQALMDTQFPDAWLS